MKKILINFIIGIICMAIGTTLLIFELSDFEYLNIVEDSEISKNMHVHDIELKKEDRVQLNFTNAVYGNVSWNYDENLKNKIKVIIRSDVSYDIDGRTITLKSAKTDGNRYFSSGEQLNFFLKGLKQQRVYSSFDIPIVTIVSTRMMQDKITINYT